MEEEYTLFIPENIKPKKDLFGDISKEDFIKAIWLSVIGGVPIGLSYFITRIDFITIIAVLFWVFIAYGGYVKTMYEGRRSIFKFLQVILRWNSSQKNFPYHYKKEWRL